VLAELGLDWSAFDFHASPLCRAAETMAILRAEIGPDVPEPTYDDRLKEGAFGTWEGRTWPDILRDEPEAHATFLQRGWDEAPHGGESYGDIARRLEAWAAGLTRDTVVVSHGGVSRALRGLYLDLPRSESLSLPTPQNRFHRFRDGQVDTL
jgi:probable phosphoglycerate mutase